MSTTKYTTPAERRRGATFADDFETNALVEKNGGTLGSAVTLINNGITVDAANEGVYYLYNTQHTDLTIIIDVEDITFKSGSYQIFITERNTPGVQFEFGIDDSASTTAKKLYFFGTGLQRSSTTFSSNAKQIGFTLSGTTGKFFVDGQQLGTSVTSSVGVLRNKLSIGTAFNGTSTPALATIKSVFISKETLTNQEVLDMYNGSTYNYQNKAVVSLPMTYETHDITNFRTLDVSGNGYNAVLGAGDGGTSTPTKTAKTGYKLDGTNDYLKLLYDLDGQLSGGTFSIAMMIKLDSDSNIRLLESTTDANNGILLARVGDDDCRFYVKNAGTNKIAKKITVPFGQGWHSLVITYDESLAESSDAAKIYLDTAMGTGARDVAGLNTSSPGAIFIGSTAGISNLMDGCIKSFEIYDKVLTETQIADFHIRGFAKFNNV